jgi:hypothetical protein
LEKSRMAARLEEGRRGKRTLGGKMAGRDPGLLAYQAQADEALRGRCPTIMEASARLMCTRHPNKSVHFWSSEIVQSLELQTFLFSTSPPEPTSI